MADIIAGYLEVGRDEKGDVVINHHDLQPDENGVGHIVFSSYQARHLAELLIKHAEPATPPPAESAAQGAREWREEQVRSREWCYQYADPDDDMVCPLLAAEEVDKLLDAYAAPFACHPDCSSNDPSCGYQAACDCRVDPTEYRALRERVRELEHDRDKLVRDVGLAIADYNDAQQRAEQAEAERDALQAKLDAIADVDYVLNVDRTWKEAKAREEALKAENSALRKRLESDLLVSNGYLRELVHLRHCNLGENTGTCKYAEVDCPALTEWKWLPHAYQSEWERRAEAAEQHLAGMREVLQEISSWRGSHLKSDNPDTPENQAFRRGCHMAFHRCAERAEAALSPLPSPAPGKET